VSTIPASAIVNVTPNVLAAGGDALDLNGLLLTSSTQVPIGTVQSFASATAVSDYFGASSSEAALGAVYFTGFDGSNAKPGAMLVTQYPTASVAAYLRGGDISNMTLVALQALSGTLSVVIDGVLKSGSVNLSGATSFSSAAGIIGNSLGIHGQQAASITGSISGTTLTVTGVSSGALAVGQVLSGTGVTANTYITALLTGTGGTGTYTVNASQTAISQTITVFGPGATYDSISGAFTILSGSVGSLSTIAFGSGAMATSLLLTSLTGAVLSQGAAAATPSAFMDAVVAITQNWATFTTAFNPDSAGNTNKLAFMAWTSQQNDRYAYVPWENSAQATTTVPATTSLGYAMQQADYAGSILVWAADAQKSVFVMGAIATIDFTQADGRTTLKFRQQAGLVADVSDLTSSENLAANGYNFYGVYATANDEFTFFANGNISGDFVWADSYVNEIWMTNGFQLALMEFLQAKKSVPYNDAGYTAIESALADPINAAVNFGAIRPGVELSESQAASVNAEAGLSISGTLASRGWYLQVLPASPTVRAARGSPPCKFWYMDGESIQSIDLTSITVQ
jgi:hypothetical protein